MSYVEMTGVRDLTENEIAMVAGGGFWGDLGKLAGGVIGKALIGSATGATVVVIVGQAVYASYDSSLLNNLSSTSIGDAAL
jgi:hypothetical protein